jgi:hypothetical protein
MTDNPIVDEVHRIRQEILAEHGGDLDALVKELQRRTDVAAANGRKVVAMRPRVPIQPAFPKKAG